MKKQIREKTVMIDDLFPVDGQSIDDFLTVITQRLSEIKSANWTSDTICEKLYSEYYGYDGYGSIEMVFYRLETDNEYQARLEYERYKQEKEERKRLARLEKNRAKQSAKEAEEQSEYERLKAKYG